MVEVAGCGGLVVGVLGVGVSSCATVLLSLFWSFLFLFLVSPLAHSAHFASATLYVWETQLLKNVHNSMALNRKRCQRLKQHSLRAAGSASWD